MKKVLKDVFFQVDVQYLEKLHEFHKDLPLLSETIKIKNLKKIVSNLHDNSEYVIHIRNLNHRLVLKRVHRLIKFNQNALLKPYVDMNTDLRIVATDIFEKYFFKLMNNAVDKQCSFWKNHGKCEKT